MKRRLTLATVALLSIGLSACGAGKATHGVSSNAASGVTLPQPELKVDAELDSDSYPGEPDNDNNHVFGHPASPADMRAATALVKHYYTAAAAGDGGAACALMYSPLAEEVPEAYGGLLSSSSPRGKTCAVVMSGLFKHLFKGLRADSATLKVAAVRVRGNHASVLLGFNGRRPADYLGLHRERGAWKVERLIGTEQSIYVE